MTKKMAIAAFSVLVIGTVYFAQQFEQTTRYEALKPDSLSVEDNVATEDVLGIDWYIGSTSSSTAVWDGDTLRNNENITQTEKIPQDVLIEYVRLKRDGNFNDQTKSEVIQSIVEKSGQAVAISPYKSSDINPTFDESSDTVRKYGNALGNIFIKDLPDKMQNEILILKEATEKNDPAVLSNLKPIADIYRNIAKDLMSVEVPDGIRSSHLDLANNLLTAAKSVDVFSQTFSDPVSTLAAIKKYGDAGQKIYGNIRDFQTYFQKKGVEFERDESGYIFIHITGI